MDWWPFDQDQRHCATASCLHPKGRRRSQTVAEGLQANCWAWDIHRVLAFSRLANISIYGRPLRPPPMALTAEPDRLIWKWTSSNTYSAPSCYQATF